MWQCESSLPHCLFDFTPHTRLSERMQVYLFICMMQIGIHPVIYELSIVIICMLLFRSVWGFRYIWSMCNFLLYYCKASVDGGKIVKRVSRKKQTKWWYNLVKVEVIRGDTLPEKEETAREGRKGEEKWRARLCSWGQARRLSTQQPIVNYILHTHTCW